MNRQVRVHGDALEIQVGRDPSSLRWRCIRWSRSGPLAGDTSLHDTEQEARRAGLAWLEAECRVRAQAWADAAAGLWGGE